MKQCTHCGWRPPHTSGLCMPCYQYKRRNNQPRPDNLIQKDLNRRGY